MISQYNPDQESFNWPFSCFMKCAYMVLCGGDPSAAVHFASKLSFSFFSLFRVHYFELRLYLS